MPSKLQMSPPCWFMSSRAARVHQNPQLRRTDPVVRNGNLFHETNPSQIEELEMAHREIVVDIQRYKEQAGPPY